MVILYLMGGGLGMVAGIVGATALGATRLLTLAAASFGCATIPAVLIAFYLYRRSERTSDER